MALIGPKLQRRIGKIIDSRNLRSTVIFTGSSRSEGAYGGYEAATETDSAALTIYCVPYRYFKTKYIQDMMGNFDAGDETIVIKGTETVDKYTKVTFQDIEYEIKEIKPLFINDTTVAQVITLSKEIKS
jgi:hypothetical protein